MTRLKRVAIGIVVVYAALQVSFGIVGWYERRAREERERKEREVRVGFTMEQVLARWGEPIDAYDTARDTLRGCGVHSLGDYRRQMAGPEQLQWIEDMRATLNAPAKRPIEVWIYRGPVGFWALHFEKATGLLVEMEAERRAPTGLVAMERDSGVIP